MFLRLDVVPATNLPLPSGLVMPPPPWWATINNGVVLGSLIETSESNMHTISSEENGTSILQNGLKFPHPTKFIASRVSEEMPLLDEIRKNDF